MVHYAPIHLFRLLGQQSEQRSPHLSFQTQLFRLHVEKYLLCGSWVLAGHIYVISLGDFQKTSSPAAQDPSGGLTITYKSSQELFLKERQIRKETLQG